LIEQNGLHKKLEFGQHLVITGGSPLLQQEHLYGFIRAFYKKFMFKPFIEIENECVLQPDIPLVGVVNCWNNSPKLFSSQVDFKHRYKPEVIQYMAQLDNSWFKFVISAEEDWDEISTGFLAPKLIKKSQIILMPEGATEEEIRLKREMVIEKAIANNVRYCTREHIVVWGRRTGI
jgi:organic radical activating enzyme